MQKESMDYGGGPFNNDIEIIVKEEGKAYSFSHETIEKHDKGKLVFNDNKGRELSPNYFGAGLSGMNGVMRLV